MHSEKDWHEQRKPYEFSNSVKKYVLEKSGYRCEKCGIHRNEKRIEIHHVVPILWAIKYPVFSPLVIRSVANAQALCVDCHLAEKTKEAEEYKSLAIALLGGYLKHAQ